MDRDGGGRAAVPEGAAADAHVAAFVPAGVA